MVLGKYCRRNKRARASEGFAAETSERETDRWTHVDNDDADAEDTDDEDNDDDE